MQTAHNLAGPRLTGSSLLPLEMLYLGQGSAEKFYVQNNDTQKNIVERNMLSGIVTRNASEITSPEAFAEVYRRELQTDNYVETVDRETGKKKWMPAFAGPVYDWRFTQMAAATGALNPALLAQYDMESRRAEKVTNPVAKAAAQEKAAQILRGSFEGFLVGKLGMMPSTAEHYASFINPERVRKAVDRFTTAGPTGTRVLLPPEKRTDLLVKSALRGEVSHADSMVFAGQMPDPVTHEELGMHDALSAALGFRAKTIPEWEKLSQYNATGSASTALSPTTEAQRGHLARMAGVGSQQAVRVLDAQAYFEKLGLALVDGMGFSNVHAYAMQESVEEAMLPLASVGELPLDSAMRTLQNVAKDFVKMRTQTVVAIKHNAPHWKGQHAFTSPMLHSRNVPELQLASGKGLLNPHLIAALDQAGLAEVPVRQLVDLDATQQLQGASISQMMMDYVSAMRQGNIDLADQILQTPIRRIPKAHRSEQNGQVTYTDSVTTMADLMNAQQSLFDWASDTMLAHNTQTATGAESRVKAGYKYGTRSTVSTQGLSLARIAGQSPKLARKISATLPKVLNPQANLVENFRSQLIKNGLRTEGLSDAALRDSALAELQVQLEDQARTMTASEFRAKQEGVLITRFPDMWDLLDLDELGRPLMVGKSDTAPKVRAPVGSGAQFFRLKPGGQELLTARAEASGQRRPGRRRRHLDGHAGSPLPDAAEQHGLRP